MAGTTLTGISLFSSDDAGNACTPFNSCAQSRGLMWSTARSPILWVIQGEDNGAFVNGPTLKDSAINVPLASGTYTFSIYGNGQTVVSPTFGLNLFFNFDNSHPKISVVAPMNTSTSGFYPAFSATSAQTFDINQTLVKGAGSLTFTDGQTKVTLLSYHWTIPIANKKDRVSGVDTKPDNTNDYLGEFTLQISAPPVISAGGVVNAASFATSVAPGSLFSIFGNDLSSGTAAATSTPLPGSLAGATVTIGGKPAPLIFASPGQINAQVPYELAPGTTAPVIVTSQGISSPAVNVTVANAAPGVFQFGQKHAVVQNQDYTTNTPDNPAAAGSYVVVYLTGGGRLDNPVPTGAVAPGDPLSHTMAPVTVTVGGSAAEVVFAGLTPGFIGLTQANIRIPNLPRGEYPMVVTAGGAASNTVTISVK
jgi:uncharacterized protein (TIGR03437 family)